MSFAGFKIIAWNDLRDPISCPTAELHHMLSLHKRRRKPILSQGSMEQNSIIELHFYTLCFEERKIVSS